MKTLAIIVFLGLSFSLKAINPNREYKMTPEMFGIKYTESKVKTPDKYDINVWEYSTDENSKPGNTIIIVGSDAGNMSYLIWQARSLREKGIRVVSFDYRGFGKSSDFEINKERLFYSEFSIDLDEVIKTVKLKYPKNKLGLYALSMGTYISLLRKEKVDFLVAEGFYNNPQTIADRIKANSGEIVTLPESASKVDNAKPPIPVLIFCASEDKTTTCEDAKSFVGDNVEIIEFTGQHLSGFGVMTKDNPGDKYIGAIIDFLHKKGVL